MIDARILRFDSDDMRYERKFYIESISIEKVEAIVKSHPAVFCEIFHKRFVNNLYLDSFDRKSYFDTVDGISSRCKVRIRWYGELFGDIDNAAIELKIKEGFCIKKISFALEPFAFGRDFSISDIRDVFKRSSIPGVLKNELMSAEFSLLNRYSRKYFLSTDRKYRVTIDDNLEMYDLNQLGSSFLNKHIDYNGCILELKFNHACADNADQVTNYFPFRMTKSSKYVYGLEKITL